MNALLIFIFVLLIVIPLQIYFTQKYNMVYYTTHRRDPQEIEHWLRSQKWFGLFEQRMFDSLVQSYDNPLQEGDIDDINREIANIIKGAADKYTISSAFRWGDTKEGVEYWAEREKQFLKWYYGQWIDFHLFK